MPTLLVMAPGAFSAYRGAMSDELRAKGAEKMREVYGFSVDPAQIPEGFAALTVDRLFGEVWADETLSTKERRLLTIGVLATTGRAELLDLQFSAALANGELTEEQARAMVVHLAHYVGWPLATVLSDSVERSVSRRHEGAGGAPNFSPGSPRRV